MATETLYANATLAQTSAVNPNNAWGASDGVYTGNTGNTSWSARYGMGDPVDTVLDTTQTVDVIVRRSATGGNGTPTCTVELYESGTLIRALATNFALGTVDGPQTISTTFNGSEITSGANVEIRVVASGNGGGPNARTVQVDSITWIADTGTPLEERSASLVVGHTQAATISVSPAPAVALAAAHTQAAVMSAQVESEWSDWDTGASSDVSVSLVVNHTQAAAISATPSAAVSLIASHAQSAAAIVSKQVGFAGVVEHTQSATISVVIDIPVSLAASHSQTAIVSVDKTAHLAAVFDYVQSASVSVTPAISSDLVASHVQSATVSTTAAESVSASLSVNHTQAAAISVSKNAVAALSASHAQSAALSYAVSEGSAASLVVAHAQSASIAVESSVAVSLTAAQTQDATVSVAKNAGVGLSCSHTQSASLTYSVAETTAVSLSVNHTQSATVDVAPDVVASFVAAHAHSATISVAPSVTVNLSIDHTQSADVNTTAADTVEVSLVVDHVQTAILSATKQVEVIGIVNHAQSALLAYSAGSNVARSIVVDHVQSAAVSVDKAATVVLAASHTQSAVISSSASEAVATSLSVSHTQAASVSATKQVDFAGVIEHAQSAVLEFVPGIVASLVADQTQSSGMMQNLLSAGLAQPLVGFWSLVSTTEVQNQDGSLRLSTSERYGGIVRSLPCVIDRQYQLSWWVRWVEGSTKTGGHIDRFIGGTDFIRIDGGDWVPGTIIELPPDGEWHYVEKRWRSSHTGAGSQYIQPGRSDSFLAVQDIRNVYYGTPHDVADAYSMVSHAIDLAADHVQSTAIVTQKHLTDSLALQQSSSAAVSAQKAVAVAVATDLVHDVVIKVVEVKVSFLRHSVTMRESIHPASAYRLAATVDETAALGLVADEAARLDIVRDEAARTSISLVGARAGIAVDEAHRTPISDTLRTSIEVSTAYR